MPTLATVIPIRRPSFSGKLPRKPKNCDVRTREYLTEAKAEAEVESLVKAAGAQGRHGHRD